MVGDVMRELERFDRVLRWRVRVSAVCYALFVAVGLAANWQGWLDREPTPVVALLLVAFFVWPQRALPRGFKLEEVSHGGEALEASRARLDRRLRAVRGLYFLGAVVILVIAPWVMGKPVWAGI
ncbi:hypothetical protein DL240_06750 [Lujinxingia litoralis]|uniref:Transmembrane protein n=1 Tax=Lujinxingia litoralis TaxID=2211119 RepID=A0A328C933_9DELT|nr:hypothetical protein [Lujinxingia litoralis]RAL23846.1 hypothetical protein DL240_06750 [Lujinxingia litoralis]